MAEAQGPEGLGDEEGRPFEVDPELIDVDDDGGMGAVPQEPQEKRRGRPPKKQRVDQNPGQETRHRAFVESNVKTALAKTDMSEVMNRYDWDSGDFDVAVSRIQPQTWHGRNIQGYIAAFPHLIDEHFIGENFGGGVYDLKIRGPNPRAGGAAKGFLDGCRVKISGDPKLNPMDRALAFADGGIVLQEPQAGPPSQRQISDIRSGRGGSAATWEQPAAAPSAPPDDVSLVKQSFSMLAERDRQSAKELAQMRERLINEAATKRPGDGMAKEALQIVRESADRAIEAERDAARRLQDAENKHREDFDRMLERVNNQRTGVPAEMFQALTEQHRSELSTAHQTHVGQILQSQERHEREINSLRERYERELTVQQDRSQQGSDQIRADLQSRLDRLEEQYKREQERDRERYQTEIERMRKDYQAEVAKMREDADRRFSDLERDHKVRVDAAQADWQRRLDATQSTAVSERESLTRSQQMQIEHLKALHDSQISQERSQRDSLMTQVKAQHEASLKVMETSYQTQIDRLASELERTRSDLDATRAKVAEQGDLASQADKLKRIGESLGTVFGVTPGALANVGRDDDIEPRHEEEPKSWFGKLIQFANTEMGANTMDALKVIFATAAGGAFPPGSVPMAPMMPQQPGMYGPPPGYGAPPGYGPTSYAPPHSPYASGPVPYQQQPQPYQQGAVVENQEDEYEEVDEEVEEGEEGEGEAQGSFVDDRQVEPAGPAPEAPPLRSPVRPDGAVTSHHPPARVPVQAATAPAVELTPEAAQQLRVLVKGLEDAMANGANPMMMAQTIAQMAPKEQLHPFTHTPIEQLIAEVSSVAPESQLTSYSGRKFLAALQQHLLQLIG